MLSGLFKPRPAKLAGRRLYAAAVEQARRPEFYRDLGVADRIDARFELYAVHVLLLVHRLASLGEIGREASQALFDSFLSALDHTLRELGVGDLSVAKKMRPLGQAIYGREKVYREALAGPAPDRRTLVDLIGRTVFAEGGAEEHADALVDYIIDAHVALSAQSLEDLLEGRPAWPQPKP